LEEIMKCLWKCWKNGEFMTIRPIHAILYYDAERDWFITKVRGSVRSSYKLSNITDVQQAYWGTFLRHDMVTVWVTDDDGNRFQFDYDGTDAPKAYPRVNALAEASSPRLRARPKVLDLLESAGRVPLTDVLERLPAEESRRGIEAAREVVQHLIQTNLVMGRIEGEAFINVRVPVGDSRDASS
jgi:hypothetical protein